MILIIGKKRIVNYFIVLNSNCKNCSLSKSFIVVSEAADSDERCSSQSVSNRRLSTFNSSSSSSSVSSKTLTPNSNER